jgi:hypothetical protein
MVSVLAPECVSFGDYCGKIQLSKSCIEMLEEAKFMSRQERQIREKQQADSSHQRQVRRNQIIFAVFSAFLILSMLISLIRW